MVPVEQTISGSQNWEGGRGRCDFADSFFFLWAYQFFSTENEDPFKQHVRPWVAKEKKKQMKIMLFLFSDFQSHRNISFNYTITKVEQGKEHDDLPILFINHLLADYQVYQ